MKAVYRDGGENVNIQNIVRDELNSPPVKDDEELNRVLNQNWTSTKSKIR